MINHRIHSFLLASLLALLFGSSCTKDNLDETILEPDPFVPPTVIVNRFVQALSAPGNQGQLELGCFTLTLPFSCQLEDGSVVAVQSVAQFDALADNPTVHIDGFVFPLAVRTLAGEQHTLPDMEAMIALYAACVPAFGWSDGEVPAFHVSLDNSCVELVYPVALRTAAGDFVSAPDVNALTDIIASSPTFFAWPLELRDTDGQTFWATGAQEMGQLLISCEGGLGGLDSLLDGDIFYNCLQLLYPFQIVIQGGATVQISSADDLMPYLLGNLFERYVYPLTVQTPSGEVLEMHDEETLLDFSAGMCEFPDALALFGGASQECFDINYPFVILTPDAQQVSVGDIEAFAAVISNPSYDLLDLRLQYPVSVNLQSNGQTIVLQSVQDLIDLMDTCP